MTTQIEAFPMTRIETAELFLVHFQAGVDKAEKSLDTARANLMHACQLRDIAEGNLRRMQNDGVQTVAEVAAEIVNSGALDSDDLTVTATVNLPCVDPITGEVENEHVEDPDNPGHDLPATAHEWDERPCQDCGGEGRLPDRTGGGHHKCKACGGNGSVMVERIASPFVIAVYPGSGDAHKTEVGDRTRYAELVADYLATLGPVADMSTSIEDWQVLAEDELSTNGGGGRNLTSPIQERDYGRCLIIAAAEQGSAAG